jgi:acetolactate decarboxylase
LKSIHLKLPETLHSAVEREQRETGEPIPHIIRSALADYLQVEHATLFQVSTLTALVEGIYEGAVSIARLRDHGDFGLGTFEGLDGEMVAFDGQFFQVRSDGTVRAADDADLSPFAAVTHFIPEQSATVAEVPELAALLAELDKLRGSDNLFYAIRVDGQFGSMHTRAMCKTDEGVPLAVAATHQP